MRGSAQIVVALETSAAGFAALLAPSEPLVVGEIENWDGEHRGDGTDGADEPA
jgi:hypothetical protein